jgi:hypothetical protein
LDQTVAAGAVRVGTADILRELYGLRVAQHANADSIDMDMTAGDAIEGIRLEAGPTAQVKAARDTLLLAIEMLEQRDKLITLDQEASRIRY